MNSISPESLSDFGKAALALDVELREYDKLSRDLERTRIDSDKGLAKAQELLKDIEETRGRMGSSMQGFAKLLQRTKEHCDDIDILVAQKTEQIQIRVQKAEGLFYRFQKLGEMVQKITESLAVLGRETTGGIRGMEKAAILTSLAEFNEKILVLIEESKKLVEEARSENLKILEQSADSLRLTLSAARNRFNLHIEKRFGTTVH